MQDGVLARIFFFLDAPELSAAEWVCKRFRLVGEHLKPSREAHTSMATGEP